MQSSNILTWVFRIFVGALFIFSGLIKANDALGFAYKLEDYFAVFGTTFLNSISVFMAITICIVEIVLGLALLVGRKVKAVVVALLAMIIFFTFLTFYSAYTGKVTDCGCFGDAIPLTPWQSFYKDVVLLVMIAYMYFNLQHLTPLFKTRTADIVMLAGTLLTVFFSLYTYYYLPVWDFRPYKIGEDIYEQMQLPEDAKEDVYETIVYYKNTNTGEVEGFTTDNLPTDDEWQWEDTESKLVMEGDRPAITEFAIFARTGEVVTDDFFAQGGYRLMIVQYDLGASRTRSQQTLNELVNNLMPHIGGEEQVWALTSSSSERIDNYINEHHLPYDFYLADGTVLKTIVRSNPGLLLLHDNKIIGKWPSTALPSTEAILSKIQ